MYRQQIIGFLSFFVSIYTMIVFVRIILTWFSGFGLGRLLGTLSRITDPYLNWFRRFTFLRVGFVDLSPIAAIGVLSMLNNILNILGRYGTITLGIILAIVLQTVWSAVSVILGFLIIILVIRLAAHLLRRGTYSQFWRIVDTVSQPILYGINRLLFRGRIMNTTYSLVISIISLGAAYLGLKFLFDLSFRMLAGHSA